MHSVKRRVWGVEADISYLFSMRFTSHVDMSPVMRALHPVIRTVLLEVGETSE